MVHNTKPGSPSSGGRLVQTLTAAPLSMTTVTHRDTNIMY